MFNLLHCRGGGEYGNDWWQDGHLLKKQNSFDDFATCAEFLHAAKYSSPAKLTIQAKEQRACSSIFCRLIAVFAGPLRA